MNEQTPISDQPRDDLNEILRQAREKQNVSAPSFKQLIENGATPHDLHLVNNSKLSPEEQLQEAETMRLMREARERRLGRQVTQDETLEQPPTTIPDQEQKD